MVERRLKLRQEIEQNLRSSRRYIDRPATKTHRATQIEVIDLEDIVVRDIRRSDKFPEIDADEPGISPWFRVCPIGLYDRGIEVFLSDSRYVAQAEDGSWFLLPSDYYSADATYSATVGRIPFHFIEKIDWSRSDGYYFSPHFYCRFAGPLRGPYEDVIYKAKLYPEVSAHYSEIGLRSESYEWGLLRRTAFLFRQDVIRWWRRTKKLAGVWDRRKSLKEESCQWPKLPRLRKIFENFASRPLN
jgi:hypothetical protein